MQKLFRHRFLVLFVDVERYDDDNLEEMAAKGRGVLYTHDHKGFKIRNSVSEKRRKELLARHYRPHWKELKAQASEAILIDLHTYPSEPWTIECHAQGSRPEIDIGFTPSPDASIVGFRVVKAL